jgi:hypothetical protein
VFLLKMTVLTETETVEYMRGNQQQCEGGSHGGKA